MSEPTTLHVVINHVPPPRKNYQMGGTFTHGWDF